MTFSDIIKKPEVKNRIVDLINENVNIPIIGEDVESLIFKTLIEILIEVIEQFE